MKYLKIGLLILVIIFGAIQFVRPERNSGFVEPTTDMTAAVEIPPGVNATIRESCYDCHSDNTRYPWYAEVQPVGWWLSSHIQEAKRHLNFSRFAAGNLRRQYHGLEEIGEQVGSDEMPLPSYLLLHRGAVLSQDQKQSILDWVNSTRESMKAKYPIDSLERRRQ